MFVLLTRHHAAPPSVLDNLTIQPVQQLIYQVIQEHRNQVCQRVERIQEHDNEDDYEFERAHLDNASSDARQIASSGVGAKNSPLYPKSLQKITPHPLPLHSLSLCNMVGPT